MQIDLLRFHLSDIKCIYIYQVSHVYHISLGKCLALWNAFQSKRVLISEISFSRLNIIQVTLLTENPSCSQLPSFSMHVWSSNGKYATSTWQVERNLVGGGQNTLPLLVTNAKLLIYFAVKSSALRKFISKTLIECNKAHNVFGRIELITFFVLNVSSNIFN